MRDEIEVSLAGKNYFQKRSLGNTFACFPDDTLDDAFQLLKSDHVSMASVCRYNTQLRITTVCSNSNSERLNSCSVYLKTGYPHTIGGWPIRQEYQHSLFPAASKKPTKCKPKGFPSSPRPSDVTQSLDGSIEAASTRVMVKAEF